MINALIHSNGENDKRENSEECDSAWQKVLGAAFARNRIVPH